MNLQSEAYMLLGKGRQGRLEQVEFVLRHQPMRLMEAVRLSNPNTWIAAGPLAQIVKEIAGIEEAA